MNQVKVLGFGVVDETGYKNRSSRCIIHTNHGLHFIILLDFWFD